MATTRTDASSAKSSTEPRDGGPLAKAVNHLPAWLPAALGFAQVLSTTFLLFPSVGTTSSLAIHYAGGLATEWLGTVAIGALAALVMCALAPLLERRASGRIACYMLSLVALLLASCSMLLGMPVLESSVCAALVALGVTPISILWSRSLMEQDAEVAERALLVAIVLVALVYLLSIVLPQAVVLVLLACLGVLATLTYLGSTYGRGQQSTTPRSPATCTASMKPQGWRAFGLVLARCGVAYAIISFAWEYSRGAAGHNAVANILFAGGFVLASLLFALFLQHASKTGIEASARWVFPVMGVGVTAAAMPGTAAPYLAVLALATGHGSFEMMLRNQIIAAARSSASHLMLAAAVGFTVQSVGVLVGVYLAVLAVPSLGLDQTHVALVIVLAMLIAGTFLYGQDGRQGAENSGNAHEAIPEEEAVPSRLGKLDMCTVVARRYGLTPREREVLAYLLEGRSHPYIRDALGISKSTVNTHVAHIYQKVGVSNRQELITLAQEQTQKRGQA